MNSTSTFSMNYLQPPKIPKYWTLAEHFRREIRTGVLRPGDRLPSLAEMREQQGISRPTMEKVHQILEQEGLIQRLPGAGTFVLEPKKRTATGILGVTGFGFQYSGQSAYWASLLGGIREGASVAQMQLLLLDHVSSRGWEKADGILLCDWSRDETLRHVPAEQPCVSLLVPIAGMASVAIDDRAAMKMATEYLIGLGHKRIAYLHGNDHTTLPLRLSGYQEAMAASGLKTLKKWRRAYIAGNDFGDQFVAAGKRAMQDWLGKGWSTLGCTALLCHNDEVAVGAIQAFQEAGVLVPRDVSIMGFDGLEIGTYVSPQLTTVKLPLREIGINAVEMLMKQIKADEVSTPHLFCTAQLRERETTCAPAVS